MVVVMVKRNQRGLSVENGKLLSPVPMSHILHTHSNFLLSFQQIRVIITMATRGLFHLKVNKCRFWGFVEITDAILFLGRTVSLYIFIVLGDIELQEIIEVVYNNWQLIARKEKKCLCMKKKLNKFTNSRCGQY